MPTTRRLNTVRARRIVWTMGLVTLASTIAAPVGRSVTDSSKLILIMPLPLLSRRDRRQLPCQERSLSCNPDQTFCHQPGSAETDQITQQESQIASRDTRAGPAVWSRLQPLGFSESLLHSLRR